MTFLLNKTISFPTTSSSSVDQWKVPQENKPISSPFSLLRINLRSPVSTISRRTANMTSNSINISCPFTKSIKASMSPVFSSVLPSSDERHKPYKLIISRRNIICSAVQETSTSTATTETKDVKEIKKAPVKPTRAPKAPVKPLPQMMEEDVIPSLKAILEAQSELSQIELSFQDNRLEGSFVKNSVPYSFWAFFPDGVLTGPKGFALTSHGTAVSTVEPFLIDEKKITDKHVVFWVEKRLAAQGIIPVWTE